MTEPARCFPRAQLQTLLNELWRRDFTVLGPQIDQQAIVYGELRETTQLPEGWSDEQSAGQYRLVPRGDQAWFGYAVGPHSWKRALFPPLVTLLRVQALTEGWNFEDLPEPVPQYALIGVRACELAAIRVQDQVFLNGPHQDPVYRARRERLFIVAVNCSHAASTCFCSSMNTGPECTSGFDLALTELPDGFVCTIGSERGREVLSACDTEPATEAQLAACHQQVRDTEAQITRRFDTDNIHDLLLGNLDHPRWKDVAERCLSCTNCTMVCPTCFCSSVDEVTDLQTDVTERQRKWDSCFNPDFSYMNSGLVRNDVRSRYRQWLTHKLASWHDQFGTSGCVGCGRCITWCPVGIDLTEEVAAIREAST